MPEKINAPAAERDDHPTQAAATTADKVLDAVRAYPGATSAQIADTAGLGRSTAAKTLASLARDNLITRTPGTRTDGTHAPDQWHPGAPDDQAGASTAGTAEDEQPSSDAAPAASHKSNKGKAAKGAAKKATAPESAEATDADGTPEPAGQRLKPGALRGLVEQYLADHPEQDYTPTALGHLLGRSSGAIANALDKLVADNYAVLVTAKPRTYRGAPPE